MMKITVIAVFGIAIFYALFSVCLLVYLSRRLLGWSFSRHLVKKLSKPDPERLPRKELRNPPQREAEA
ncbi:MAG: hypothetical protein ACE5JX_22930 [Acidobacteriota bacterium]